MPYVIAAIALVVIGFAVWWYSRDRATGRATEAATGAATRQAAATVEARLDHEVDFHVAGSVARVTFDVPANAADDPMIRDVMVKRGYEVLRRKRTSGLPVTGIDKLEVYGMEAGQPKLACTMDIDEAPEMLTDADPEDRMDGHSAIHDPLEALTAVEPSTPPSVMAAPSRGDDLPPLGSELRIPSSIASAISALGHDPSQASASALGVALLEHAGYTLTPQTRPGTYLATGKGGSSYIVFVDHLPGSHPELGEEAIDSFMHGFMGARADRGFLLSDKFGPYSVYAREKREPKVRFITRERMQSFVDSIAMG